MKNYRALVFIAILCFSVLGLKAGALTDIKTKVIEAGSHLKLITAAGNGTLDDAKLQELLSQISKERKQSSLGNALIYAARFGKTDTMRLLNKAGADPNYANGNGITVLMYAVASGVPEAVRFLISQKNVNINQRAQNGSTALMRACGYGRINNYEEAKISGFKPNPEIVKILLDAGANLSITDLRYKGSALTYATFFGSLEVVEMLVEKGANPMQTDVNGKTPVFYAKQMSGNGRRSQYEKILKYYEVKGYKVPDERLAKTALPQSQNAQ